MTVRAAVGPLVGLTGLVLGIVAGEHRGAAPATAAMGVGIALAALAWLTANAARRAVVCVALVLLGCACMQRALDGLQHPEIARGVETRSVVRLTGELVSDPDGPQYLVGARFRADTFDRIMLVKASGEDAGRMRALTAGDRVVLAGELESLPVHGYDARERWNHVAAMLVDAQVISFEPARQPLGRVANWIRDRVVNGTRPLGANERALVAGFLLGDTRGVPDAVIAEYRASGLSHLLAVSGANVAFVLVVFSPALRRCALPARTAAALVIVTCFAAATRFEPSVLRASALATVSILATFVGRPVAPLRALSLAVIALLLLDPFLVHSVGFQLSCAASAGIAVLAPALARRLPGPRVVREPLAVSIAAQAGVTPVLLATFGGVPVISPLANLLAAPAAEALGVFGLLACVVGGVVPSIGIVGAPFVELLVGWVSGVAHATAGVGGEVGVKPALGLAVIGAIATVGRRARRAAPDPPSR